MRSASCSRPKLRASSAEVDTFAIPISSNTFLGSFSRRMSSLQPPPPEISRHPPPPTPCTVRPRPAHAVACMTHSQLPPRTREKGAATTGLAGILQRHAGRLEAVNGRVQFIPFPSCAARSTNIRFAPTLKFSPSFAITSASKFRSVSSSPAYSIETASSPKRVHLRMKLEAKDAVTDIDQ